MIDTLMHAKVAVAILLVIFALGRAAAQSYTAVDLGTLPGLPEGETMTIDLNNAGQVLGSSWGKSWIYRGGTLTELPFDAVALNDAGDVVGQSLGSSFHAVLYTGSTLTDLGTLGGEYSGAWIINNVGQVVGEAQDADGEFRWFLYRNGAMSELSILGSVASVTDINTAGQIVGETIGGDAFLLSGGVVTNLGTIGGTFSSAIAINDTGQVAGRSDTVNGYMHAFLYSGGVMTDLGTLGGPESEARGLNNAGQVVGFSTDAAGSLRLFLYSGGVMKDLGRGIGRFSFTSSDHPVVQDTGRAHINDSGQIAVSGFDPEEGWHALLLLPDASPTSTTTTTITTTSTTRTTLIGTTTTSTTTTHVAHAICSNAECDDGNPCNGVETCQGDFCVAAPPLDCDDHDGCTLDACDVVSGAGPYTSKLSPARPSGLASAARRGCGRIR